MSRELISNITEVVVDEIKAWQARPLDEVYPILYIDGCGCASARTGSSPPRWPIWPSGWIWRPQTRPGCVDSRQRGAKFWQKVVIDLRNRGVRDILIACCDGLTGLPYAIRSIFPDTVVQTCVVHVIRNAMRFVSYKDRKKVATAMRAIYSAPTVEGAELALKEFDTTYGAQYPGAVDVCATPGRSSCRSWTIRSNYARSSTPPMRSSRSISSCARSPRTAAISPTATPR